MKKRFFSVYLLSWATRALFIFSWSSLFWIADGRIVFSFFAAALLLMSVWPRCPRCGLPTFWRRKSSDPDHFVYYRPSAVPHIECVRCGANLI